jgi:hypothetical protein
MEIPPEIHQMQRAAAGLAELVNRIGVDRVVLMLFEAELIDAPDVLPDEQAIEDRLRSILAGLEDLATRLAVVVKHGKARGRKTDRPRHLVGLVASVIERDKSKPITRSKNRDSLFELLMSIVAIVDPEIGRGTVEEVLKARSRRRGEI